MKCPECGSPDVSGHDDPNVEAAGWMQCPDCGFSDLADGFDEDDEEEDGEAG